MSAARRLARIEETVERLDRNVQQIVGMLTKQRYQQREHDAHTAASRLLLHTAPEPGAELAEVKVLPRMRFLCYKSQGGRMQPHV